MQDPEGIDGELIDRLIVAMDSPREPEWENVAWFTAYAIGGPELDGIAPQPREKPTPGTLGALMLEQLKPVSRVEYFRRIKARLTQLVRSGVREDLLVRALRDELTANFQKLANTEVGDTRRDEFRAEIEQAATTPEGIAEFRASSKDPEVASLTDEQLADRVRRLADFMTPTSREEAQQRWDRVTRWQEDTETVSDHNLDLWRQRNSLRGGAPP
jgi:hypothetical protein